MTQEQEKLVRDEIRRNFPKADFFTVQGYFEQYGEGILEHLEWKANRPQTDSDPFEGLTDES